jgi:myo-inositol-1(or 4)-monophosphatase
MTTNPDPTIEATMKNTTLKNTLAERLVVGLAAAKAAGLLQREGLGQLLTISTKSSPKDLVTNIDLACDALIRAQLGQAYPDDTLITEESFAPEDLKTLDSAWIVDPLDGTTNYTHGFPQFAVSIAYVQQGRPMVGIIWDELRQEAFTSIRGQGAWLNDQPIRVSTTTGLANSLLSTGFPPNQSAQDNFELFVRLTRASHGVRRAGAAALDLAYVACGRLDGFWEPALAPWDVAAGSLLVEEAGGYVCNYQQQAINLAGRTVDIMACNHHDLQLAIQALR